MSEVKASALCNLDAEREVVSVLLRSEDSVVKDEIFLELSEADFCSPVYRTLFQVCRALWQNREAISIVSVIEVLEKSGELEKVGGAAELAAMIRSSISDVLYMQSVRIMQSNSAGRKAQEIAQRLAAGVQKNPGEAIATAMAELSQIGQTKKTELEQVGAAAEDTMNYLLKLRSGKAEPEGVAAPYVKLNYVLQNFRRGETTIIAARPSMGKSAFVQEILLHAALQDLWKVALFSLEMSKRAIVTRMYANITKSSMYDLQSPDKRRAPNLQEAFEMLKMAEMYVDDTTSTLEGIVHACRVQKKRKGLDLVCIDYLGLVGTKNRQKDRRLEIEYISRQLKLLAQELDIPVIVCCQMNRAIEYASRMPMLADLRESGAIEQDASQVIFLHRNKAKEDVLNYRTDVDRFIEVSVAKNRNGAIGMAFLRFEADRMRFVEIDKDGREIKQDSTAMTIEDLEPVSDNTPFDDEDKLFR